MSDNELENKGNDNKQAQGKDPIDRANNGLHQAGVKEREAAINTAYKAFAAAQKVLEDAANKVLELEEDLAVFNANKGKLTSILRAFGDKA